VVGLRGAEHQSVVGNALSNVLLLNNITNAKCLACYTCIQK